MLDRRRLNSMKPRCIISERWVSQGELQRWGSRVDCLLRAFVLVPIAYLIFPGHLHCDTKPWFRFSFLESLSASIIAMLSRFANQLAVDALSQFIPHNTQHTSSYIAFTHTLPSFLLFFYTLSLSWTYFFIASFSVSLQLTPSRRASRSKPQIYILLPWVSYKNL